MRKVPAALLLLFLAAWSCSDRVEPGAEGAAVALAASDTVFYQELSWSPKGESLLLSVLEMRPGGEDYTYRIYRVGANGSKLTRLSEGPRDYWTTWSPDGSRIAFGSFQQDNLDIYVMDANGKNRIRLTDDPAEDTHPNWSPDGARLVFVSGRDGRPKIYVMNADGSDAKPLSSVEGEVWNPVWSPDGGRIAFYVTDQAGKDHVHVMNADGTGLRLLAEGVWPSWSPDGSRILYGGSDGLYVMNADGTERARVVAGDAEFGRFSPDGSRIGYIATEAGHVTLNVMRVDGTDRRTLLRNPAPAW